MNARTAATEQEIGQMSQSHASERCKKSGGADSCHLRGSPCGQLLFLTAIAMVVLIGFAALATDVGLLWSERRRMQTAADAAAIAGATALRNSESIASAADNVASLNGFTNGTNSATIAVNNPPASGLYSGNSNYVEVIVTQPEPTYFLRVLGYDSMRVSARAVSGAINGPACVYSLDPAAQQAIYVSGTANITAKCGVIDNSNSSTALDLSGTVNFTANSIGVVGDYTPHGTITVSPEPVTAVAAASDPLISLAEPSVATYTPASSTNAGSYSVSGTYGTVTVPPSVYAGGVSIQGTGNATFSGGTYGNGIVVDGTSGSITFNPGQYQGNGSGNSIHIEGTATATFSPGGQYTFDGPVLISGTNTLTLSPGTYYGGISVTGSANLTFNPGTYVLAGGGLSVTGTATLQGTGVTFYDTTSPGYAYGPISLKGTATSNLSAPTSGSYKGILVMQDRSIPAGSAQSTITGTSSSTFDGVLYFPTTALAYDGTSSGSGYTSLIADTIKFTGTTTMTLGSDYSSLGGQSPIQSDALYE